LKVLLDENIPHDLRPDLRHHDTFTAAYLGWAGLKNGELLDAAKKTSSKSLLPAICRLSISRTWQAAKSR
jgi:hypothetical protein